MRVLLFAALAEALGRRELSVGGPGATPATAGELESRLRAGWPELRDRPFRVAVNQRYARREDPVAESDEIALIPPVSGG